MIETFDAAEPDAVRKRNRQVGIDKASRDAALVAMMGHTETRAWIWELLTTCSIFHTVFAENALTMAFREGSRNVGLKVFAEIMAECPEMYQIMVKEANERSKRGTPSG